MTMRGSIPPLGPSQLNINVNPMSCLTDDGRIETENACVDRMMKAILSLNSTMGTLSRSESHNVTEPLVASWIESGIVTEGPLEPSTPYLKTKGDVNGKKVAMEPT